MNKPKLVISNPPGDGGGRKLNEAEVRAALTLVTFLAQKTRSTLGKWQQSGKRPSFDAYFELMQELLAAEQAIHGVAKGPPTDGHSLDPMIDRVLEELRRAREQVRHD